MITTDPSLSGVCLFVCADRGAVWQICFLGESSVSRFCLSASTNSPGIVRVQPIWRSHGRDAGHEMQSFPWSHQLFVKFTRVVSVQFSDFGIIFEHFRQILCTKWIVESCASYFLKELESSTLTVFVNDILCSVGVSDFVLRVTDKWKLQLFITEMRQFSVFHFDSAIVLSRHIFE